MLTPAIADRVAETTTTEGTGTLALAGALTGFRAFVAAVGSGREVEYTIAHRSANEWEVGVGTVTSGSPNTLTRARVKSSSNGGALVSLSSGIKDVFVALPSQRGRTAADVFLASSL